MNCRRVSNLLSAYLDAELTGSEMLKIRAHLDECPACRAEYQTLQDTKHLLASLALQAPRAEFEALLNAEVERASGASWIRMPAWLTQWQKAAPSRPRTGPLALAAALSVAALLLPTAKTASVDTAPDGTERFVRAALPQVSPHYREPTLMSPPLPLADPTPPIWTADGSPTMSAGWGGYNKILYWK